MVGTWKPGVSQHVDRMHWALPAQPGTPAQAAFGFPHTMQAWCLHCAPAAAMLNVVVPPAPVACGAGMRPSVTRGVAAHAPAVLPHWVSPVHVPPLFAAALKLQRFGPATLVCAYFPGMGFPGTIGAQPMVVVLVLVVVVLLVL